MQLLFASDRMHVPDDHSGSVQTTHTLIQGMARRNHECRVLATLRPGLTHFLATATYRLTGRQVILEVEDSRNGYAVRRGSEWRLAERVRREIRRRRPDALVLDAPRQLRLLEKAGIQIPCPVVVVLHELAFDCLSADSAFARKAIYVANSPFTAKGFTEYFGLRAHIIPPTVDFSRYIAARPNPRYVTMISPTESKGIETTLHLAAVFPDVPFLLVEGWPMDKRQWRGLEAKVAQLTNVTLRRSTNDMSSVYQDTKILLVPSWAEETFGRVVVEAQANGIPVIARQRGALPWVVGQGGITIPESSPDSAWEDPLGALFFDENAYTVASNAARANATRTDFELERILDAFETIFVNSRRSQDPSPA